MKSEAYLKLVSSGQVRRGPEHEKEKAKEEGLISEEQTSETTKQSKLIPLSNNSIKHFYF